MLSFFSFLFGKSRSTGKQPAADVEPFASLTDPGRKRSYNEDSAVATRLPDGSVLLAVADGVGGLGGGDIASAETIEAIVQVLSSNEKDDPNERLAAAFASANTRVREAATRKPDLSRMASTLAVAMVDGSSARLAHLGDSRAYLFHRGILRQLTEDHSWVADQVRAGNMTNDEAEQSQFRNVITRGVGVEEALDLDSIQVIPLPSPSVLLLCSDGLFKAVDEEALCPALELDDPRDMARQLVAVANEAGGPDNIAVALMLISD